MKLAYSAGIFAGALLLAGCASRPPQAPAPVDAAESRDALHILECARESSDTGRRTAPAAPRSARYAGA